jgi:pimeloyl-ACP methyl ester carboxylesterase
MQNQDLRKSVGLAGAALLALMLMPTIAVAQEVSDLKSNGNLHLRGYGSFFIQGNTHTIDSATASAGGFPGFPIPGGLSMIDQMYVQYMLPQAQNGKKHSPIVFVHGCCLSSKSWQTTPDGRMGWDEYFARQGFDTYLADQVSRARSGFDATKYNMVRNNVLPTSALPAILIASDQFAWNIFRWGTTPCTASPCSSTTTPHPDIRFPMNTVGVGAGSNLQFYNQVIPDMNGTLSNALPQPCAAAACTPPSPDAVFNTPAQMAALANKLGGAILVAHSESANFPSRAALQAASGCYPYTTASACKVKGIIQLETGCFGNLTQAQITTLSHIPILIMYGDYANGSPITAACTTMINQVTAAGGDINFAWLPQLVPGSLYPGSPGPIYGNEHMMMLDNNNQQVAQILIDWASSRGL